MRTDLQIINELIQEVTMLENSKWNTNKINSEEPSDYNNKLLREEYNRQERAYQFIDFVRWLYGNEKEETFK